jgi:uncharacterized protein CbrC (UPF0167 family)
MATGAVVECEVPCKCCGRARGAVYAGAPYCEADGLESAICPWCIADGSAAAKFAATFVQDAETELAPSVRAELFERTPGYECWQGENWLCHCNDACEFHGDISREELQALAPEAEARFLAENDWIEDWPEVKKHYRPRGDMGLYKFVCRHCGIVRLGVDMS